MNLYNLYLSSASPPCKILALHTVEPLYKDIPERRTSPLIYLDDNVIKHWRELTAPIVPGCQLDEHKMELLKEVCRTWITVRAHSFVEGCNFIFHKSLERGTRKILKSIGTEARYMCTISIIITALIL